MNLEPDTASVPSDPFARPEGLPALYRVRARLEDYLQGRKALEALGLLLPPSPPAWGEVLKELEEGVLLVRWPGYGWPVEVPGEGLEREGA